MDAAVDYFDKKEGLHDGARLRRAVPRMLAAAPDLRWQDFDL
ncbi:hypothetical protein ACFFYR_32850 [Paraburkholderia dipogonis]